MSEYLAKERIEVMDSKPGIPDPKKLAWAFPNVSPGQRPYGGRVIVQLLRTADTVSDIIHIVKETKENEKWNNQVGKLIAIGPLAFKNRDTMEPWAEGAWASIGDYVRVPRWGGDRWERLAPGEKEGNPVLFAMFNDHELIAEVTDDPLSFNTFLGAKHG